MMLMEHEEGRTYVKAMLSAIPLVEAKNEVAKEILVDKAKAYLQLLKEHIQKEDEILFKIADDVISPDEQKQLLRSFEEHEAKEIGEGVHEKYLKIAEELEQRRDSCCQFAKHDAGQMFASSRPDSQIAQTSNAVRVGSQASSKGSTESLSRMPSLPLRLLSRERPNERVEKPSYIRRFSAPRSRSLLF